MTLIGQTPQALMGFPDATHPRVDLWRGDTWVIRGSVFQEDGVTPLDLSEAEVNWSLATINSVPVRALNLTNGVVVMGLGSLSITVMDLPQILKGPYWDRLTVMIGGVTQTYWVGEIRIWESFPLVDDLDLSGYPGAGTPWMSRDSVDAPRK